VAQGINLLQIGCGQMGGAMLAGMLANLGRGLTARVVDPQPRQVPQDSGVSFYHQLGDLPADYAPDVVVLAVKPQQVMELLPQLAPYLSAKPVVISIAAGITLAQLAQGLGGDALVNAADGVYLVRAMPNLPAVIGQAITAWCAASPLPPVVGSRVEAVLGSMGYSLLVAAEGQMDAVTAISGSGPAYLFYLAECLMAAAQDLGLSAEVAEALVLQTLAGSGQLLRQRQGDCSAAELRQQVTSPAGTTAAALSVLMQSPHGLAELMAAATAAAHQRSIELRGAS
jgi:pyrroline-5-carboxylate reductase